MTEAEDEHRGIGTYFLKTMKWTFIVFSILLAAVLVFAVSLFFREQRLPDFCIETMTEAVSTSNLVVSCERASFGFRQGLCFRKVRVYDRAKKNSIEPIASLGSLTLNWMTRQVVVTDLKYPRLPDYYYLPVTQKAPYVNWMEGLRFRDMERFQVRLIRPEILGIVAKQVDLTVKVNERSIALDDFHLLWPVASGRAEVAGATLLDVDGNCIRGQVHGQATQSQIRPFIETLDIGGAISYIDAFTEVAEPVDATCSWDVDTTTCGIQIRLGLHPKAGKYRGVAMRQADGSLTIDVQPNPTNYVWRVDLGSASAVDVNGHQLTGMIGVCGTNAAYRLFLDVDSHLPLKDAVTIAHVLDDGILSCFACETAPHITADGVFAPCAENQGENAVRGTVDFQRGKFFSAPVENVSFRYDYIGDTVTITNFTAKGKDGGSLNGWDVMHVPGLDPERATFRMAAQVKDGAISELADFFGFDPGEKYGTVNAQVELTGGMGTNRWSKLNGSGKVEITEGRLAQLKLFAGLTEMLADKVPGISSVVNQSEGTCTFVIKDGVLSTEDIAVEGSFFSVKAYGSYDIVRDRLDFTLRVQFLRNDSLLGKVVHPVTWVFTKLLLEYRVTGSIHDPKWEYITIPERIIPR